MRLILSFWAFSVKKCNHIYRKTKYHHTPFIQTTTLNHTDGKYVHNILTFSSRNVKIDQFEKYTKVIS